MPCLESCITFLHNEINQELQIKTASARFDFPPSTHNSLNQNNRRFHNATIHRSLGSMVPFLQRNFSGMSDASRQLADDVQALRRIVNEAWFQCLSEYFQLVTLRLIDPKYSRDYIDSCLSDAVEFNNFTRQLDSHEFRNRQVWRAWHYIRELVVKYQDSDGETIARLDKGARESTRFKFIQCFGGNLPKAHSERGRPKRKLTPGEWNRLPKKSVNIMLDEAIEMCGCEVPVRKDWNYDDVFSNQPQRIMEIFG
jgi:hypothetical protein